MFIYIYKNIFTEMFTSKHTICICIYIYIYMATGAQKRPAKT